MPAVHLGPLQLEGRRRPFAGMLLPSAGEQDSADIQKQRRDLDRSFHVAAQHRQLPLTIRSSSQQYGARPRAQAVRAWIFPNRFLARRKQIGWRVARGVYGQMPPSPRQDGGQPEIDRLGTGIEQQA